MTREERIKRNDDIKQEYMNGTSRKQIAEKYKIHLGTVDYIILNKPKKVKKRKEFVWGKSKF